MGETATPATAAAVVEASPLPVGPQPGVHYPTKETSRINLLMCNLDVSFGLNSLFLSMKPRLKIDETPLNRGIFKRCLVDFLK